MVVKGNFLVRLVDATTKEPFKEHVAPDGTVYAETEPDAEYFIEMEVIGGSEEDSASYFQVFVDGNKLEQYFWSKKDFGKHYEGIASFKNGVMSKRAFRFEPPKILPQQTTTVTGKNDAAVDVPTTSSGMMGSVKVQVSEAIYVATTDADFQGGMRNEETEISTTLGDRAKRKALRTVAGKDTHNDSVSQDIVKEANAPKDTWEVYVDGKLLEEFHIKYCTALGLIYAGILEKPPLYDLYRLEKGLPKPKEEELIPLDVPFKKVVVPALYEAGTLIQAETEYEMFDLTNLDDESHDGDADDDEEEEEEFTDAHSGDHTSDEEDPSGGVMDGETAQATAKPRLNGGVGGVYEFELI